MAARRTRTPKRQTPPPPPRGASGDLFVELGSTGLHRYSGMIDEELKGPRGMRVYREMRDNDPVVGAVLLAVETLIRGLDWRVAPASQEPLALGVADHVESCLQDLDVSWSDTVSSFLEFLPYGWSWHEVVYKYRRGQAVDPAQRSKWDDGAIGWRKLPIRSQDSLNRWVFDEAGELEAMVQVPAPDFQERTIPLARSLHFRVAAPKGSPEGRSVLRNAYRPWYFAKRLQEIEAIGIERELAGLPVLSIPSRILAKSASPEEQASLAAFRRLVREIRRDAQEGVIVPSDRDEHGHLKYELSLLASGGRRQLDVSPVIERYDRRIALSVLADLILLGHEKVGSYALATSKTGLFSTVLWAFVQVIAQEFNRRAIPDLVRLNGWPEDLTPTLEHGDIENVDLRELAEYISKLAGAGAALFPDTDLENVLRRHAALPERIDDDDDVDDDLPPTPPKDDGEEEDEGAA